MNTCLPVLRLLIAFAVLALWTGACTRAEDPEDFQPRRSPAAATGAAAAGAEATPAAGGGRQAAPAPRAQPACTTTLKVGSDISAAIMSAAPGTTLCLSTGTHRAFSVDRPPAGITVAGAGEGQTVFPLSGRSGIGIRNAERFTLAGVTVRGGSGDGIYAATIRGLKLYDITVESAGSGIHIDSRSVAELEDITVTGTRSFGLLLRRSASVTATRIHVRDSNGIGIGATDGAGPVSIADSEITRAMLPARAESLVSIGTDRLTLTNVSIHGGSPAGMYIGLTPEVTLRGVRVEAANFGLHIDDGSRAQLEDVTLTGSAEVGLLVRQGASVTGSQVRVVANAGTGVSAIAKPGPVTLRDSEIGPANGPGLFMGAAGCDDLPPASLEVPECFLKDPPSFIADGRVELERVTLHDTVGPCLVFFPGTRADIRDSTLTRCELTGLFAWGAEANVTRTTFDDNAEHALEYRAYPDPRGDILREAAGVIADSVIRNTRPLEGPVLGALGPGPVLGGGILAQRSRIDVRNTEISANRDIGLSYVNGSGGEVTGNRIHNNGNSGLCILSGTRVTVRDNVLTGNRNNDLNACGGYAAARS
jgi:hypothetical protein